MKSKQKIFNILFLLTGATSLIYETSWQKLLTSMLGSDFKGTSILLGIMLGMMGLGYYFFGQVAQKLSLKEILKLTAKIEFGIAGSALLFPILYNTFIRFLSNSNSYFIYEIICSFILIAPASFLLGGNLPLITHYLTNKKEEETKEENTEHKKSHFKLYTFNTFGAFLGALLSAYFLIPQIGLSNSIYLSSLINFLVGLYFLEIAKKETNDKHYNLANTKNAYIPKFHILLALFSGLIAVSLQSILTRILAISVGSVEHTFAVVVAVYILSLSLGTKILAEKLNLSLLNLLLLSTFGVIIVYFLLPQWPYIFHLTRINFGKSTQDYYLYNLAIITIFFILVFFVTMPLGAILPKLFALNSVQKEKNGFITGLIYGSNSLGFMLGSFVLGYIVLEFLNFEDILKIIILSLFALYFYQAFRTGNKNKIKSISILSLTLLSLFYQWPKKNHAIGIFSLKEKLEFSYNGSTEFYNKAMPNVKIIANKDGNTASVSVAEFSSKKEDGKVDFNRTIMINGKPDGNTEGDLETMRIAAYVGALFAGEKKSGNDTKAAIIGLGVGLTSGATLAAPWIKKVDTIEISKEVVEFKQHFDFANNSLSKNLDHRFIIEDAYYYFARNQNNYDLIVSLLTNFWMSGIEKLYTTEYYNHVYKNLDDEGTFIQWIGLSDISSQAIKIAMNTFTKTFSNSKYMLFGKTLLMLGKKRAFDISDLEQAEQRIKKLKNIPEFNFIEINNVSEFLLNEIWIPKEAFNSTPTQSIDKPKLSYLAGKDYFKSTKFNSSSLINDSAKKTSLKNSLQSLTSLWSLKGNDKTPVAKLLLVLKNRCGIKNIKLIEPEWRYSRSVCREVLIELMKSKRIKTPKLLQKDFAWLENFKNETLLKSQSTKQSKIDISRFASFYSVFDRLDLSKLEQRIQNCFRFGDKQCQNMITKLKSDIEPDIDK